MGYELNRLMKQYGVGTSSMATYSGTAAPQSSITTNRPDTVEGLYTTVLQREGDTEGLENWRKQFGDTVDESEYNRFVSAAEPEMTERKLTAPVYGEEQIDPVVFAEQMRKYGLDQKSYDMYKTDYQNRLQNTPMYAQSQFQTTPQPVASTVEDLYKMYLGRDPEAGIDGSALASTRPSFIQDAQRELSTKPNFGNQNLMNATGSYYSNQLKNPTYGAVPLSMVNYTPQEKADYYLQQRNIGYTDADLRGATTKTFGTPAEADWTTNLNLAYPEYAKSLANAYGSIGRTGFTGSAAIDNPGYNWWMNQLSTGAVKPEDLTKHVQQAALADNSWNPLPDSSTNGTVTLPDGMMDDTLYIGGNNEPYDNYITRINAANKTNGNPSINESYDDYMARINAANTGMNMGPNPYAHGGLVYNLADKYAHGGKVKTHYQTAGEVDLPGDVDMRNRAAEATNARIKAYLADLPQTTEAPPLDSTDQVTVSEPVSPLTKIVGTEMAGVQLKDPESGDAPPPVTTVPSAPTVVDSTSDSRTIGLRKLLDAYGPKTSAYDVDLKAARTAAKAESDAFAKMLTGAMSSPEDETSSKAEMYFRLAAAFGSPTRTGNFAENLGMVGKELGEYAKDKRASRQQKLALALKGQELKMGAAKEDLGVLRALSAEEMKDKRAIATELIKEYIKSGEPQSAAGKQAKDEGLVLGTPEYKARVAEIGNANVEAKMAQITAAVSGVGTAAANLAVSQGKFDLDRQKFEQQKEQQARLTPPELKLKVEAEDLIASSKQSLADLKKAYALNPNSLAGGWLDKGQQWLAEAAKSEDPVIVNTRVINNLLSAQGLAKLRATFGGNPTEGERSILLELEGIGAKTKDERGKIILRAYQVLQDRMAREQARLDKINAGKYRTTTPEGGNE